MDNSLQTLGRFVPVAWDRIPDFGLYMDQVISFITDEYAPLYGDADTGYLSAAMINNYVRAGLVPRPTGKKYNREQIAILCMIVGLKQVCKMEDIGAMLKPADGRTIETIYSDFSARQCEVLKIVSETKPEEDPLQTALAMAINAACYSAGAATLLKKDAPVGKPAKEKKKKD